MNEQINNKNICAYPCGVLITTKLGKIDGMITCISIRFDKIQYEITYLKDGEEKTSWMNEMQFIPKNVLQSKHPIGYKY